MRIALGQFNASLDKNANLARMAAMAGEARAAAAELVLFPEGAMVSFEPVRSLAQDAEPLDGPFVAGLAQAARANRVAVVAGLFESIPGSDRVYNTVVAVGSGGELIGSYHKIHLFDAFGYRESERIEAGAGDTLGFRLGGLNFGVETCYDVRFPELSSQLAAQGADVILLPAAWVFGLLKESHWEILVRARAIENTLYVAAAGQVGKGYSGSSMLVDPMGVAVASAGETEQLIIGEVERERVEAVRRKLPSRDHVRPDVYRRWALVAR
ncbi:MAG: hydrolase [Candidatus Nephthysia bennettiae]|uniref:Carbon-nitrogen hydrolase family protein n=1 Tax=Candidatus Nephthysia bennettiae TaxID=3127016 RepID=A0A934N382_9BACT|nr:carbon-nitrogen hydrolase family protein [Candidatus Dormibacteraeota bacterium]MBJ7613491.1 carbon-nitrogen hydrolase family protein [Candidatus Dormibacteraeota bacterium]PZR99242.1 MAG: hydrolase [Candidatus Dormibacteraeota bacterium]